MSHYKNLIRHLVDKIGPDGVLRLLSEELGKRIKNCEMDSNQFRHQKDFDAERKNAVIQNDYEKLKRDLERI